jgi:hypothetical protein
VEGIDARRTEPPQGPTDQDRMLSGIYCPWHIPRGAIPAMAQSSANYAANSTAGQGAASPPYSASASYAVSGGHWFLWRYQIYLPLALKSS